RACAKVTRLAAIAASFVSSSMPWMKERSTLIMSTGKWRSWPSDEKPVPKSSIAIRTPSSCSACSSACERSPPPPPWPTPPAAAPVAGRRLRGLAARVGRRQGGLLERPAHHRADAGARELPPGEIAPGDELLGQAAFRPPARGLKAGLAEHERAEREDQARRL